MGYKRILLAIAFALLLAACGGDEATPTTTASAADGAAEEEMVDEPMSEDDMSEDDMSEESMAGEEMSDDSMSEDGHMPTTFTVTITSNEAAPLPTPLAPGAYLVHTSMDTLFVDGEPDRGAGLEALAEDGDPSILAAWLESEATISHSGTFANPDGGTEPGPALPGSGYSFTVEAVPGDYLTFATMFVQSNDWFFAPASSGLSLFDGDTPIEGDITDLIRLWDAGTEVDETPGEGANQAPRQAGPDTGDDQDGPISSVPDYDGTITVTIAVG